MRRVSADAFRKQQTDNQSDKRAQNKEPKNRSQKKEKVAKSRERERDRKIDKVRICFACANHVADKARLATFKYICTTHTCT